MGASEPMDRILWHGEGSWQETTAVDTLLHELRAPLGASSFALDVMMRLCEEEDAASAEMRRLLRTARLGVLEAQALVRWFYRMRTAANGRLEPEIEISSVPDAIERALILARAEERVRVTVARDVPMVYADSLWLTRTLTNLIENAIKHTPETAMAQVFVRQFSPDRVVVSVIDNGSGIPVERQREIFRPYVRVGSPEEGEGQGLGLSIAHYFVRAMGGRIWLESDGRSGTTVRFTLPIAREREADG